MWFFYLLSAIGVSIGTGAFVAYESEQKISAVIQAEEPATRAENSAQISRALRRLHQIDPSVFPVAAPDQTAQIPASLLAAATVGGISVPDGIIFEIDSAGKILARVARDPDFNQLRFEGSLVLNGVTIEGQTTSVEMSFPQRNIALASDVSDYDFETAQNLEGVHTGEDVSLWSAAPDITDTQIQRSSRIGSGLLTGRTDYVDPYLTDPDFLGRELTDYEVGLSSDASDGLLDPDSQTGDIAITDADIPQAYTGRTDIRYGSERQFDAACIVQLQYSTRELERVMEIYSRERQYSLESRIDNRYAGLLLEFTGFWNIYSASLGSDLVQGLYSRQIQNFYDLYPEWEQFSSLQDASAYYDGEANQEKQAVPPYVDEEIMGITEGIEATQTYCSDIYGYRIDFRNNRLQANSGTAAMRQTVSDANDKLLEYNLDTDPDMMEPKTENMTKVADLVGATFGVHEVIRDYPKPPQRINWNATPGSTQDPEH